MCNQKDTYEVVKPLQCKCLPKWLPNGHGSSDYNFHINILHVNKRRDQRSAKNPMSLWSIALSVLDEKGDTETAEGMCETVNMWSAFCNKKKKLLQGL